MPEERAYLLSKSELLRQRRVVSELARVQPGGVDAAPLRIPILPEPLGGGELLALHTSGAEGCKVARRHDATLPQRPAGESRLLSYDHAIAALLVRPRTDFTNSSTTSPSSARATVPGVAERDRRSPRTGFGERCGSAGITCALETPTKRGAATAGTVLVDTRNVARLSGFFRLPISPPRPRPQYATFPRAKDRPRPRTTCRSSRAGLALARAQSENGDPREEDDEKRGARRGDRQG